MKLNGTLGEAQEMRPRYGIHNSVLDLIGGTPLIRLDRLAQGVPGTLLAKAEFLAPGGSVKDRLGLAIIADLEQSGRLAPGGTIVEATAGNTGIGLAQAAVVRGYRMIFVMPDKMSAEKIAILRAYGAEVIVTPTAVAPEDPRSYYSVARRVVEETPGAVLADQYFNPVNPMIHYLTTGPEIWNGTGGTVTHVVAGAGTGGTITGVGRYLKEQNPDIQVILADPVGSVLHRYYYTGQLGDAHGYKVEGIGEDMIPGTLDFTWIDAVVQVTDRECFGTARRLAREEALFCGGSSGGAMAAALKTARTGSPDDVRVVILPDSGTRYYGKLFNDQWLRENDLAETPAVLSLQDAA